MAAHWEPYPVYDAFHNARRRSLGQGPSPVMPPRAAPVGEWKEYYIYTFDFTGSAALTGGAADARPTTLAFAPVSVRIDSDADFELGKTMYFPARGRVYARYKDETRGQYLHRGTLDLRAVAGIGQAFPIVGSPSFLPYIWPAIWRVKASSLLSVEAADFSGLGLGTNAVRLSFHGAKCRSGVKPWDDARVVRRVAYTLPWPPDDVDFTAIAANATVPVSAPIDAEGDFLVHKITGVRTGEAIITIQDGPGRERLWMDRAVHIDNLVGNGSFPNILPAPRFVFRGSTISGTIRDLSGATNYVRLYFHGERLYYE